MKIQTQALDRAASDVVADETSRGALFRRLIIFQIKLFADGLRDLVFSPISFVAAGIGILFGGRNPHGLFDRLMHAGHVSDAWIDLFGHHAGEDEGPRLERMIDDVESALRADHARGGVTAEAEKRLRTLAEELRRRASGGQSFGE
jgi:hypothetical protein